MCLGQEGLLWRDLGIQTLQQSESYLVALCFYCKLLSLVFYIAVVVVFLKRYLKN